MDHTYFEFNHRKLRLIEEHTLWAEDVVDELQTCKMEPRFMDSFSWSPETPFGKLRLFACSSRNPIDIFCWEILHKLKLFACFSPISSDSFCCRQKILGRIDEDCESCHRIASELVKKSDEILIFLDAFFDNLKNLLGCKKGNCVPLQNKKETLEAELVFLHNCLRVAANCLDRKDLRELRTRVLSFLSEATRLKRYEVMGNVVSNMLGKIELCARDMRSSHFGPLRFTAYTSNETLVFLDSVLKNIKVLVSCKADKIVPLKKQMDMLEGRLVFMQNILKFYAHSIETCELREFKTYVLVLAENAACLTLGCWLKGTDGHFATKMDLLLSEMPKQLKPSMPYVAFSLFGTLEAMDLHRSNSLLVGQTVATFVNLLLDQLANHLKDDFQFLWEGLVFLLTFFVHPPNTGANDEELTLVHKQIAVLLWEESCLISFLDDANQYLSRREVSLFNFIGEIELINTKIRQLYCKFPESSSYNFPRIIGRGFLDYLIQNLRTLKEKQSEVCVPFAKYKILTIEEELVSLRPFFNDLLEFQNEHEELNDTWLQAIDLVHLAEHVTNSCFDFDYPIWYHMAYLSAVIDRIKVVRTKIELMNEGNMVSALPSRAKSVSKISEQARVPEINDLVVGLVEETNIIIDKLTRGHKSLDIVSIVGMAGLGKTTLARKVYGTSLVKSCFNIFCFTSVSKDQSTRRLLLDILSQITLIDDDISCMTKDDLSHRLWKCLSGQKYLIVLDDIWEIRAWNEVKSSFPDDQNGSRVMLTTRFQKVSMEAQIRCSPYTLSFLSEEKSWELLKRKIFYNSSCPEDLSVVGKLIAKKCNGLPLAVVLIAGILATKERSLSIWSEISERVVFYLCEEGLMEMLELSYKHLPGHLKPCVLYFGAFPEDMLIPTKILMQLWIAEGFVYESETMSLENVAKEYLKDIADRSLIIINSRSSSGGIKTFRIHDVIQKFCQMKAREEKLFLLGHGTASSSSSDLPKYNHYRVFLHVSEAILDATPVIPSLHSLICFQRCNDVFDTQTAVGRFKLNYPFDTQSVVGRFKLVQVLYLENMWLEGDDFEQLSLLVHLRHIVTPVNGLVLVPSSVSNLWKLETFVLRTMMKSKVTLPKTIWTMKSLRHVNISKCKLTFSGGFEHDVYPQLDNVESFSSPTLSTEKDLRDLLQRLPAVRKLSCHFVKPSDSVYKLVETLDFDCEIESLNLSYIGDRRHRISYVILFPSTLRKLKLVGFELPWTAISDISKLPCLEVLMLHWKSVVGPRWDTEDVEFKRLKFLKMNGLNLVRWNASPDSFPCLEQLFVIGCDDLIEIPACFGEISTLKRFEVHGCNKNAVTSANQIKDDQMDLGNESLECAISNTYL